MTKKELSQLYYSKREIESQQRRIEKLEALEAKATSCNSPITGTPSSSRISDKVGNFAAQIADLKSLIELNKQKIVHETSIIERDIQDVDDPLVREIMRYRFIDCCSWPKIAHEIGTPNTEEGLRRKLFRYLNKY